VRPIDFLKVDFLKVDFLKTDQILLDLAFLVLNMLTHHRVIFLYNHLFGHGAGVLFGHIKVASVGSRVQPDLDRGRFGHLSAPSFRQANASPEILEACVLPMQPPQSTFNTQNFPGIFSQTPKTRAITHISQPNRPLPDTSPVNAQK
jgi:hypothetical protein